MRAMLILSFLSIAVCPTFAQAADDKEAAKEHFFKGKALVEEGAYEKAIVELEASYKLSPAPVVLYNIGVCYDYLQKFAKAATYFKRYIAEGNDEPAEKKQEVEERVKALVGFLGTLKIEVDQAEAEVIVDDEVAGQTPLGVFFLETGGHDVVVRKTGFHDAKKKVTIVSGQETALSLKLESAVAKQVIVVEKEQPQAAKKKKLASAPFWAMMGLAGASAVAAIATGVVAKQKDDEVAGMYDDEEWKPVRDEGKRLALATDVLIGLAGASAVACVVLAFFTDFHMGKREKKPKGTAFVSPSLAGGSIVFGYEGRF